MMTGGTKELFQTVVGPRQIGHVITVKQAWPVAPGDLQEVLENASDLPGPPRFPAHAPQQISIAPTNRGTGLFLQVVENRRSTMDEAEGHLDGRPHRNRLRQAVINDVFQLPQFGAGPFFR
jgi:hypothetical protein